jgi:hypothetical protein
MEPILEVLNHRRSEKGIASHLIPAFFRDFSCSLSAGTIMNPQQVGVGLERLGWDEIELDNRTFELMVWALEAPEPV